ncbi:NADP-dependent phosphogluconate dehydrogenase [Flavobacteriaceae bacterium]|nr:NADP-dependent phosphogluconate dehydrogenase [Flavobacteriaceae bacterium]
MKKVIFIMGVSGSGKSTIGELLSQDLDIPYYDGDDYHSKSNIEKMSNGQPLNDEERQDWLETLNELAINQLKKDNCIIVCSALKLKYRDILSKNIENEASWVHLFGSFDTIYNRINARKNHFMPSDLLMSQFDTLEIPMNALQIDVNKSTETIVDTIKKELILKSELGVFGLGVMGKSLCRNLASKGFKISMYNRNMEDVEVDVAKFFKTQYSELSDANAYDDIGMFVNSLQKPRRILLMVNAGKTIDNVIEDLLPHLSERDILIDGGNSNYKKTKERINYLESKNIHFIGTGISGGEKGALKGPSIMPSGNKEVYTFVQPFFEAIAAKDKNDLPCCTYVGPVGSGHFIKMVHNGIEYVEMQLLAEVTTILEVIGQNPDEIADTLVSWKNEASSYLLDITALIFRKKEGKEWLVNKILDKAANKGTGSWTTIASAELGVPSTLITSALFSRYVSFYKEERQQLDVLFEKMDNSKLELAATNILEAYQFARILNHYQGFKLINEASNTYNWSLNLSEIARIWTNGCIIKSALMEDLVEVFQETSNILNNTKLIGLVNHYKPSVKKVVSQCVLNDISAPTLSEAIQFFNGITTSYSSANVIQAQRDYFGAHTYKRLNDKSEQSYHTIWDNNS